MAERGFQGVAPLQAIDPRLFAVLYHAAITLTLLSGAGALAALVAGSPLQFGVALALCSAGWIAVDFVDRSVERAHVTRRRPCYGSPRVVYVGGHARFSRPAPEVGAGFAPSNRHDFAVRAA